MLTLLCGLLGLFVGSFLNVVIYRVPRGESVVTPRSHCPGCDTQLAEYDNIPVASWVLLKGRCRTCQEPISARYPLVELVTAAVWGLLAWHLGAVWELPAFLYLGAVGVALAAIDIDTKKLPNAIVLPSYAVGGVLLGAAALLEHSPSTLVRAGLAGAALYAFYALIWLVYPAGMGFGDVKLSGVLGIYLGWLGWATLVVGGFLGFVVGGVVGGLLMVLHRAGRKTKVPYGPWMLLGALIAVLWGQTIADWYRGFLG